MPVENSILRRVAWRPLYTQEYQDDWELRRPCKIIILYSFEIGVR
jgi:hypothetical protein